MNTLRQKLQCGLKVFVFDEENRLIPESEVMVPVETPCGVAITFDDRKTGEVVSRSATVIDNIIPNGEIIQFDLIDNLSQETYKIPKKNLVYLKTIMEADKFKENFLIRNGKIIKRKGK